MQKDHEGRWILDDDETALDAFCMAHGGRLVSLDTRIAAMPADDPNRPEIERYRRRLAHALLVEKNGSAAEGWFNALLVGLKTVVLFIPKAKKASRQGTARNNQQVAAREADLCREYFDAAYQELKAKGSQQLGRTKIAAHAVKIAAARGARQTIIDLLTETRAGAWIKSNIKSG